MKIGSHPFCLMLAVFASAGYYYLIVLAWGWIPIHNPLFDVLLLVARADMPILFRLLVYIQDFFINAVLAIPLAYFIYRLRPNGHWWFLIVGILAMKVTENFWTAKNIYEVFFSSRGGFYNLLSWLLLAASIAFTFWLIKKFHRPPN